MKTVLTIAAMILVAVVVSHGLAALLGAIIPAGLVVLLAALLLDR
jgi:xanthine/uracil permease